MSPYRHRPTAVLPAVALLVALSAGSAACSSPSPSASNSSTGGTTHGSSGSASTGGAHGAGNGGSTTTTNGSSSLPRTKLAFGATINAFSSAFVADNADFCSPASPCYGPAVVNAESGSTFEFTDVLVSQGLVLGYDQSFASRTPLSKAEALVLQFLPADAHVGPVTVDTNGGSCGLFDVTSPSLADTLNAHPGTGDTLGIIGVDMSYTDNNDNVVYDPDNIQDASVTMAPVDPSEKC